MSKERLEDLEKRRSDLQSNLDRIRGKKEAAEARKKELIERCEKKKIDPEKLSDIVVSLKLKYDQMLKKAEEEIEKTEKDLAPYLRIT